MKKVSIFKILAILITSTILVASCTKENPDVRLDPKLSTSQVIDVKSDSATVIGFVVAAGDGFSEKGICYNTEPNPTTENNKVIYTGDNSTATFTVVLSGLHYATTYYARAYASNGSTTLYGEEYQFTTMPILPTVTTAVITDITGTTATGGGNITNDGGADITERGVVFLETENPTLEFGFKTSDGTGAGEFTSSLTGLQGTTTYHVRAYAKNSVGVTYGEDVTFTTLVSTRTWYVPGDYVIASYPGSTYLDWDPANSPQVKSVESSPDNLEGYINMANATNSFKFASQPNWDGPNYGDNGPGVLSATGENISLPAGYYKMNINPVNLTYTAVATQWGVIGNATPSGWDDETPLTYEPALKTWTGGMHIVAGDFKFRANHSWDYNYGSTAGDNTLNAGGDNIPLTVEADYYFVLDLSTPNTYTYSAHYWGLIGDATPGGWDSDQNMTWDAANHAMTLTVDLTVGAIKFRADDAWDLNFGGDPANMTIGGDNIQITEAGNYTIKLYITGSTAHATIVKNVKRK